MPLLSEHSNMPPVVLSLDCAHGEKFNSKCRKNYNGQLRICVLSLSIQVFQGGYAKGIIEYPKRKERRFQLATKFPGSGSWQ
jgi:hypothetical protein